MPLLQDHKRENFAQAMVAGKSPEACCIAASFKYSPAQYSHLKAEPLVKARVQELQKAAVTDKVADLSERLEMLSEFARDTTMARGLRLRALHLLHIQSGDDVSKSDIKLTGDMTNSVKHVIVSLPEKTISDKEKDIDNIEDLLGNELDNIESFLQED